MISAQSVQWSGSRFQDSKLLKRSDAIVEANFLGDLAIFDTEHRCTGETHLAPRSCGQRAHEEITKRRAGVRAATLPTADDNIALGNEIGRAPKLEIRESRAEIHHEVPNVLATATRRMQRILKQHVGRGEFINDVGVPRIAPKPFEPSAHNGLVVLFT